LVKVEGEMKMIVRVLVMSFINLVAYESFGQLAAKSESDKEKADTTHILSAHNKPAITPVYSDLPRMPKKKEPANKLFLEGKREIKKTAVKRRYKHERRVEARITKKRDKKHGIIAERKKKDRMFK
jgi:hypothetical protein